jgi:hypothetical protein
MVRMIIQYYSIAAENSREEDDSRNAFLRALNFLLPVPAGPRPRFFSRKAAVWGLVVGLTFSLRIWYINENVHPS